MLFDYFFGRPKRGQALPRIGYVSQDEYDALRRVADLALELNEQVRQVLRPFADVGALNEGDYNSALQLARNAASIIEADKTIIKRLLMEQEQLTEQLDIERRIRVERENALLDALSAARGRGNANGGT